MSMSTAVSNDALLLGRSISVRLQHVGAERQPLMIVDHVLEHPQAMIEAARRATFYAPRHTNYPGINARLPQAYYLTVVTALRGPIEAAFGLSRTDYLSYFGFFALAITSGRDAQPVQKIPHRDAPDPNRLAMVHYLCRGQFGGTGFFRHRATGFESVDAARQRTYEAVARRELAEAGSLTHYAGAGTRNYELIGQSEAVFNRLIVYRSHVLHSALLGDGSASADPGEGRLTANGFIEAAS
ncbi:MAG: DUF6445 family protein [Steroidobacter sp.]